MQAGNQPRFAPCRALGPTQTGLPANLCGFYGAPNVLKSGEENDPLKLLALENTGSSSWPVAKCPGWAPMQPGNPDEGSSAIDERRSTTRRTGADRRSAERRAVTLNGSLVVGRIGQHAAQERRNVLRRRENRPSLVKRPAPALDPPRFRAGAGQLEKTGPGPPL